MTDYINDAKKRADDSGYFVTDYIKRSDAARAMAKYIMDTALIDNPEASDRIEEWEGNIAAPVMSTVEAADVRENVRGEWIDCGVHGDWAWEQDGHGNCWHIWKCSQCGYKTEQCSNFCPNCGADMRGEA